MAAAAIYACVMKLETLLFGATYWLRSLTIVVIVPLTNPVMMDFRVFVAGNRARRDLLQSRIDFGAGYRGIGRLAEFLTIRCDAKTGVRPI